MPVLPILRICYNHERIADMNPSSQTQDPFYAASMTRTDKKRLADAQVVRGLNDEIALLRLKLGNLVDNDPDNIPLIFKGADLIVRAVAARTRVSKDSPEDSEQAIYHMLKDASEHFGLKMIPWDCECGPECHSQS